MPVVRIEHHVEALQRDLAAVAALGDERAHELVARVAAALESSLRMRLLEVLSEAAQELSAQMRAGHVEVRLAGSEPALTVVEAEQEPEVPLGDDLSARITLRLPPALKARVEEAATREGVSVNTWLVQALGRSVEGRPPRGPGRRLTGYARS